MHELPPNGQGLASLVALGILERLGATRLPPDSVDVIHLQVEAMKLAFGVCKRHVADPEAMQRDPAGAARARVSRFRSRGRSSASRASPPGPRLEREHGTVYLAAADGAGRMVSFIQSNYLGFGSGVVVPGTGIAMQNRALGFSLDPRHPNCIAGRKRPYHTIMPGFVTRAGKAAAAFGCMGGHMQPQGHVQLLLRLFPTARIRRPPAMRPAGTSARSRRSRSSRASEPSVAPALAAPRPRAVALSGDDAVRRRAGHPALPAKPTGAAPTHARTGRPLASDVGQSRSARQLPMSTLQIAALTVSDAGHRAPSAPSPAAIR